MSKKILTVVIPTYNRINFIGKTIDSVISQSFENFEVLIIDDGSTDDSGNYIKNKYSHDKRVKYFYKENEERGVARNYGIKQSSGVFVVFLDSDDLLLKLHLESLYFAILKEPNVDFIATKYELKRGENYYPSELNLINEGYYGIEIVLKGNPFACNFAVRRINENLILFKEKRDFVIVEDWVFLIENLLCNKIYLVDVISVVMNDHDLRSMRGTQEKIIKARLYAMQWVLEQYQFNDLQVKLIAGNSYFFCAIHNYIDGYRFKGIQFLMKAYKLLGFEWDLLIVAIKLLIGRRYIQNVSKILNYIN